MTLKWKHTKKISLYIENTHRNLLYSIKSEIFYNLRTKTPFSKFSPRELSTYDIESEGGGLFIIFRRKHLDELTCMCVMAKNYPENLGVTNFGHEFVLGT